ncbi:MAG TPA: FAD-dependent oxidoreductase [Stellaceae bacterium]|nr:FAD-dependent oxidoreductase [Stellaceae bacterium]
MSDGHAWDRETDIIVIGSGSAALTAALAASTGGARVIILEKSDLLGGTSAMSGAGTWIPANHHMLAAGMPDTPAEALTYLRATAPAGWQAEEDPLWQAFAETAPEALKFIEENTPLRFELVHHPDLYVEAPGGKMHGRMVSPQPISKNILGIWRDRIRSSTLPQIFTYRELVVGTLVSQPIRTLLAMAPTLLHRFLTRRVGMGNALVTGLLRGCLDRGCEVMIGTRAERLLMDGERGRIAGVEARAGAAPIRLRALKGVVLATGGFEWDPELRAAHFPGEVGLIATPRTNTGDGHKMAAAVGARLARMDQANIYACTVTRYEGERHGLPLNELYAPHCLLVNRHGRRFVNEGDPNLGVAIDTRDPASGQPIHPPCWRIFDAQYAAKNPVTMWLARRDKGYLRKAGGIAELARAIDLDPAALRATVERFNGFARAGKDYDFLRGETEWERFYTGDPERPNGNGALGTIEKPPFYAAPYYRAIIGTKGGPRTNERGQVLREDGSVISGLYCAGIAMANPIGTKAVGAGTTIGPCLTWGYICGKHLLRENA